MAIANMCLLLFLVGVLKGVLCCLFWPSQRENSNCQPRNLVVKVGKIVNWSSPMNVSLGKLC